MLESVDLRFNCYTDRGIAHLSRALETNRRLCRLDFNASARLVARDAIDRCLARNQRLLPVTHARDLYQLMSTCASSPSGSLTLGADLLRLIVTFIEPVDLKLRLKLAP